MQVFSNTPLAGHIQWSDLRIVFLGTEYVITNGSTNARYAWWIYGATQLTVGNILPGSPGGPAALTDLDLLVFLNKNGTPIRVPLTSAIDGDLIVDGTVLARHIAANQITADHLQSLAISVDDYIQSTGYSATAANGWRIEGDGTAEFNNVIVRGISMANMGAFDNVIVTGGVMRSQNYASGSAGWRITGAGDAEFNSVTVRGKLFTGPTNNEIHIGQYLINNFQAITFGQGLLNMGAIWGYKHPTTSAGILSMRPPNHGYNNPELAMKASETASTRSLIELAAQDIKLTGTIGELKAAPSGSGNLFSLTANNEAVEIGKYLDFHNSGNTLDAVDFDMRIMTPNADLLRIEGGDVETYGYIYANNNNTAYSVRIGEIYGNKGLYSPSGVLRLDSGGGDIALSWSNNNFMYFSASAARIYVDREMVMNQNSIFTYTGGDYNHRIYFNAGNGYDYFVGWNAAICLSPGWDIMGMAHGGYWRCVNEANNAWRDVGAANIAGYSDPSSKRNMVAIDRGRALEKIKTTRPFTFQWEKGAGDNYDLPPEADDEMRAIKAKMAPKTWFGLAATEVPEEMQIGMPIDGNLDAKGINVMSAIALLWGATDDVDEDHKVTKARLAAAEAKAERMEARLATLERAGRP